MEYDFLKEDHKNKFHTKNSKNQYQRLEVLSKKLQKLSILVKKWQKIEVMLKPNFMQKNKQTNVKRSRQYD